MAYLHIIGSGTSVAQIANNKGHLFEKLIRDLFRSMKVEITHLNKSENGLEIDIEGKMILGGVKVFAECKAKNDTLNSTDIQKFGFKYLDKKDDHREVRGFLLTLSGLNPKAQEIWDSKLVGKHGDGVSLYQHDKIVEMLIDNYSLSKPEVIRSKATGITSRSCGDTQLLCIGNDAGEPELYWAQLLMSADGTEPNYVAIFNSSGILLENEEIINRILTLKSDLASNKVECVNLGEVSLEPATFDDITPSRAVVRVRMSSDWFDYRFPAAPEYFVGRSAHLAELDKFALSVIQGKTTSRGILVTGRSGMGKSSLILKARESLRDKNVVLIPIDSRLSDDVGFVFDCANELLFELRQNPNLADSLREIRVHGLDSLIETFSQVDGVLKSEGLIAVVFFDQFEKVFELPELASAIRTLFLRINDRQLNVLFGFAWKSDLWSMAEGFPHAERDDIIRESIGIRQLSQFDQDESSQILHQLESQWGEKLSVQLTRQLATFSRGLPWLLKKVCSHVLDQKAAGTTETELIETNLKLQDLFESDLAGLDDQELSLLRAIAALLPATLRRLSESFEIADINKALQRFIDRRILVKITEDLPGSFADIKYDTYSDIFREFLISGKVPLEDAYYFFTYPKGALNFFEKVRGRGILSVDDERTETGKQIGSIYNLSKDLRNLRLIEVENKVFRIADGAENLDGETLREYLQSQLKKNRVVSLALSMLNENDSLSIEELASLLQEIFPSVEAQEKTWVFYSRIAASWLHEARLVFFHPRDRMLHRVDDEAIFERVVGGGGLGAVGYRFPVCFRNAIINCLEALYKNAKSSATIEQIGSMINKSTQSVEKAMSDNLKLGFADHSSNAGEYVITDLGIEFISSDHKNRREIFRAQAENIEVFNRFIQIVRASGPGGISSSQAAENLIGEMNIRDLSEATIQKLGSMLANWADYGNIISRIRKVCILREFVPQQSFLI